ncbi:MAG: hypothetical protein RIG82_05220 [Phycisphaeraceae bacterium]
MTTTSTRAFYKHLAQKTSRKTPDRQESIETTLGVEAYRIPNFDQLPPFLVSLLSEGDTWCFVSSRGALTAGRVEPAHCLFPYITDNELHQAHTHTGPITLARVSRDSKTTLWSPLRDPLSDRTTRSLAKTILSDRLIAEEHHSELKLDYRSQLAPTAQLGIIRSVTIQNTSTSRPVDIDLIDGYTGLIPSNVNLTTLSRASCLVDAYTQAEVDPKTTLATISLTAGIVDTAEPAESLHANIAWSTGLDPNAITLDANQLNSFRDGKRPEPQILVQGQRSGYLIHTLIHLEPGESKTWHIVLDARQTQGRIVEVQNLLRDPAAAEMTIEQALAATASGLTRNVESTDAAQTTGDAISSAHHRSNVLFNNARGGVPASNYDAPAADVIDFVTTRHRPAAEPFKKLLGDSTTINTLDLIERAADSADPDLQRLALEYLPLTFGRRHGDPSRPWNYFAIHVQDEHGEPILNHQGNWRDIFQNWEALALSFPAFLPGIISKFVNASTLDGFNPYRITRDGIDWEKPDPEDPWANIGYWGDHQIIYLLRLLEALSDHDPKTLNKLLASQCFTYANVPYRIKPYADMVADPRSTITFDADLNREIDRRVENLGSDGRLLLTRQGKVHHVGLVEKLLIPLLSKLSNLVPDGGVWMNTQRPEWNDANNALAGYGVSVVTLAYVHRYASFMHKLIQETTDNTQKLSTHVADWLKSISDTLEGVDTQLAAGLNAQTRRTILDRLGEAFETYRLRAYADGPGEPRDITREQLLTLLDRARTISAQGLDANRRDDNLYHSYNVLDLTNDQAEIKRLPLMLEGQVAALSSGALDEHRSISLLESLHQSPLYRDDQKTFMLYPKREMPSFLSRAVVAEHLAASCSAVERLESAGDRTILYRDANGELRFASSLINCKALDNAITKISAVSLSEDDRAALHDLYEQVFEHQSYTGRSGSMFAYEGNGCIYWHMVAKLLLAAQEASDTASTPEAAANLQTLYTRIRSGLGFNKTASEYGAFPLDAYSHSAWSTGARQPGMTGQVKEEVITRRAELGVRAFHGAYHFKPSSIAEAEWLAEPTTLSFHDLHGNQQTLSLENDELALTLCQVPVIYRKKGNDPAIHIHHSDRSITTIDRHSLPPEVSQSIMRREGKVTKLVIEA